MKHFLAIENHAVSELAQILDLANYFKANPYSDLFKNKTMAALFFNPSTRTRTSFDLAMHQSGGHCVAIEPGKSSWGIEVKDGVVMDDDKEEHLKDVTNVLCRYADLLGVRCFPRFMDWKQDKKDEILNNLVSWSTKPIINMETISHPCQALAMMNSIQTHLKTVQKKKFVLTWGYHPKPLNTAVANSAAVIASIFGMDVTIANPPDYDLDPYYTDIIRKNCDANHAQFTQSHDQDAALEGADYVYLKSWGSLKYFGPQFEPSIHTQHINWKLSSKKMSQTHNAYFSHCLPLRRNMLVLDEVIDGPRSLVYEEAENRLHVQKAVIAALLNIKKG